MKLLVLLAPFLTSAPVVAQDCMSGEVRILVDNESAGPLAGAPVLLRHADTVEQSTTGKGVAQFDHLPCGAWSLEVTKEGFQTVTRSGIVLRASEPAEIRVTLLASRHESVDVHASAEPVQQTSSGELHGEDVKDMPGAPSTVTDVLPLIPGVARSPQGGIVMEGASEHRSAFVVNRADVTDPATGGFGTTIPVDSVQSVSVLKTPFTVEYGRFTAGIVSVATRAGGDKWHYEINDLFPDFRIRSWHMDGIRDDSPRAVLSGPILARRLYFAANVQYDLWKRRNLTLPYPHDETKQEATNSFLQTDAILSTRHILTATFHMPLQHISFVNPDYFNPQPVTPNYREHSYEGTVTDTLQLGGGTLASAVSLQRFDASVWGQGTASMILTPTGNSGNYFSSQSREAGRYEWMETWSLAPHTAWGTHDVKLGTTLGRTSDTGEFSARPIFLLDNAGNPLENISFTGGTPFQRSDVEGSIWLQDHWSPTPRLAFDLGSRMEAQQVTDSLRIAPRVGVAWTPFAGQRTVVYAGFGMFYDRVPLNVYAFSAWPQQVVTLYGPGGAVIGGPTTYANVIGPGLGETGWLLHSGNEPGNFSPRSAKWSLQVDHTLSHLVRLRVNYSESRSDGLVVIQPATSDAGSALVMSGSGHSQYRQLEVTSRFTWAEGQQFFVAYTRSRAQGDLNEFSNFLGNFPSPLIHPDAFANLPGDLPNRFLAWGRVKLPWQMQILPMFEYRNGFPYVRLDALGNYAGAPNSDQTRYPDFLSMDARVIKDIRVSPKYTLRFSVSGLNLTNHFNPLDVHANIADPLSGVFFGDMRRRFLADFDVVF
ncbi:MAG: TonB-dependent receptor [Bryobacteraceae bacterium]